ncbi:MAG: betaine-aldehyde dehydrogenase [Halobacteriovoraceae bacterium]|nr:betaine-aldehyde dehydrogenase [Halobacteriovoraceae bacterium]|tara:strand:- start:2974 stop:4485 length:1512 start_codon:yes stop_codon:yes gene_type:complete
MTKKKTQKKTKEKTKAKSQKKNKSKTLKFNYAPALESTKVEILEKYGNFIGGEFVAPKTGKYFDTVNPADGKKLASLALSGSADVDLAVKAARKAFKSEWSQLTGSERGKFLFRIARIIQERSRELAVLETLDGGKPIKESRDVDIPLVAQHFFYNAGWADKLDYLVPGKKVKPIGVCGQIIPWNFPMLMLAWKIAPALAAGNTVVLKPAEQTSLTALKFAEICQEAGLPKGVVNIITGAGETGAALVDHKDVNKIAFTGSTDIGKLIARNAGKTNKKLTMELGGKSANIVFADAAIDQAVEGIVAGIFFNQGHVCCAGSRLLIEESVKDLVIKKLKARMKQIRVGAPLDKNTDLGAINSKEQLKKIRDLVKQGQKEGGEFWQVETVLPTRGNFFAPCLFMDQSGSSTIAREEVFGPVLSVSTFRTPDEAIAKANDTNYGLAAGIWSEKGSKVHMVASKLKAGIIWANTYNKFDATSPFGGFKESGYGREGGRHGVLPYVEVE